MNNPKDNDQSGIAMDAASMGHSTPPIWLDSHPQGGYPCPPSAYPSAPQPGFQPAYPQSNPQGSGGPAGYPVPAPASFKAPCPQNSQGPQLGPQGPHPVSPPAYSPPVNINTAQNVGEDGDLKLFDFTEKSIRRAFIRKVYGILMCQLLTTLSFIALFLFCEPIRKWVVVDITMLLVAFGIYIVMGFVMICCGELRRKAPHNFIFLGIFTLATSYMLGAISCLYDADLVMIAVGLTAAVVLALTLFAFQTKYDFTVCGGGLLCALVIFIIFGLICAFRPNRTLDILYSSIGALIFSLYIVYDTQLMLGGNHKYTITPEEYIFAALNLYLDIINLFLRILYLVARR